MEMPSLGSCVELGVSCDLNWMFQYAHLQLCRMLEELSSAEPAAGHVTGSACCCGGAPSPSKGALANLLTSSAVEWEMTDSGACKIHTCRGMGCPVGASATLFSDTEL